MLCALTCAATLPSKSTASVPALHNDGKHPHLVNSDQTCWTPRSNAIKLLLVVGDDGHKITRKITEKLHAHTAAPAYTASTHRAAHPRAPTSVCSIAPVAAGSTAPTSAPAPSANGPGLPHTHTVSSAHSAAPVAAGSTAPAPRSNCKRPGAPAHTHSPRCLDRERRRVRANELEARNARRACGEVREAGEVRRRARGAARCQRAWRPWGATRTRVYTPAAVRASHCLHAPSVAPMSACRATPVAAWSTAPAPSANTPRTHTVFVASIASATGFALTELQTRAKSGTASAGAVTAGCVLERKGMHGWRGRRGSRGLRRWRCQRDGREVQERRGGAAGVGAESGGRGAWGWSRSGRGGRVWRAVRAQIARERAEVHQRDEPRPGQNIAGTNLRTSSHSDFEHFSQFVRELGSCEPSILTQAERNVKTRVAIKEGKCWRRSETSIESQLFVQGLDGICFLKNNSDIKERTKKKILINYTKSYTQARRRQNGPGGTQCGVGGRPECPGSAQQRRAAGGCAPHEGAPCRGGPVRTGSVQQLQRRAHARAPGVNPKESTEPISGPSGGAHGYAVRGGGRAAGAGSAHNSYGRRPGVGAARRALVRNAHRGQGSAHWVGATGAGGARVRGAWGHTEEGVGPLGYAWRRVRPSRIGGASPGSERRGGTTNRRTAVLGAGSTCIPHGVGSFCVNFVASAWSVQRHFRGNQSHSKLRKRNRSSDDSERQHGEGTELQWGAEGKGSQCGGGARAMMENDWEVTNIKTPHTPEALLPVGGPPSESGTENSVSSSLPLSPMLATSIADESGSDRVIMLDEIVVKQRARWDYKTNMTLGARREHSGRKTSIDEGDPVFVQD
ncbi:hypothetical protein B0H14DRAFT_3151272 [Mycena olivaceomarginata]|nr:hypothetical protein B0H14DRAFT_3151272 [Mycena olivaceomarginata]